MFCTSICCNLHQAGSLCPLHSSIEPSHRHDTSLHNDRHTGLSGRACVAILCSCCRYSGRQSDNLRHFFIQLLLIFGSLLKRNPLVLLVFVGNLGFLGFCAFFGCSLASLALGWPAAFADCLLRDRDRAMPAAHPPLFSLQHNTDQREPWLVHIERGVDCLSSMRPSCQIQTRDD